MKTRNGFVSNSSSSSFIVAINPECKGVVKLTLEVDLNDYAETVIRDIKGLDDYFENNYDADYKDNEDYQAAKRAIENGKVICVGLFSSDGNEIQQFLCNYGIKDLVDSENKEIEVINGEGGY